MPAGTYPTGPLPPAPPAHPAEGTKQEAKTQLPGSAPVLGSICSQSSHRTPKYPAAACEDGKDFKFSVAQKSSRFISSVFCTKATQECVNNIIASWAGWVRVARAEHGEGKGISESSGGTNSTGSGFSHLLLPCPCEIPPALPSASGCSSAWCTCLGLALCLGFVLCVGFVLCCAAGSQFRYSWQWLSPLGMAREALITLVLPWRFLGTRVAPAARVARD